MKKRVFVLILAIVMIFMTACNDNYKMGIFTISGYASEYLGYRFVTPEGFELATRQEANEEMNRQYADKGYETINVDDDTGELHAKYVERDEIIEMMAREENGGAVMTVILEKKDGTAEDLAEYFKNELGNRFQNYTLEDKGSEVVIGGNTYVPVCCNIKDGRKQYNMDTYYRKVDNRIMTILVVSYTGFESKVEELLEGFEVY